MEYRMPVGTKKHTTDLWCVFFGFVEETDHIRTGPRSEIIKKCMIVLKHHMCYARHGIFYNGEILIIDIGRKTRQGKGAFCE